MSLKFLNMVNVLNNRVYGIYSNVITVHNENAHRLWGYGSVGQLLNIVLVTLRRAGYWVAPRAYTREKLDLGESR